MDFRLFSTRIFPFSTSNFPLDFQPLRNLHRKSGPKPLCHAWARTSARALMDFDELKDELKQAYRDGAFTVQEYLAELKQGAARAAV